ncbi:hypothetical protein [Acetobacterium bakii]|nr:hypothetical protein [Acetobacterium bakii]
MLNSPVTDAITADVLDIGTKKNGLNDFLRRGLNDENVSESRQTVKYL